MSTSSPAIDLLTSLSWLVQSYTHSPQFWQLYGICRFAMPLEGNLPALDHKFYPHLFDIILSHVPPSAYPALRATCHRLHDHVDMLTLNHIAVIDTHQLSDKSAGSGMAGTLFATADMQRIPALAGMTTAVVKDWPDAPVIWHQGWIADNETPCGYLEFGLSKRVRRLFEHTRTVDFVTNISPLLARALSPLLRNVDMVRLPFQPWPRVPNRFNAEELVGLHHGARCHQAFMIMGGASRLVVRCAVPCAPDAHEENDEDSDEESDEPNLCAFYINHGPLPPRLRKIVVHVPWNYRQDWGAFFHHWTVDPEGYAEQYPHGQATQEEGHAAARYPQPPLGFTDLVVIFGNPDAEPRRVTYFQPLDDQGLDWSTPREMLEDIGDALASPRGPRITITLVDVHHFYDKPRVDDGMTRGIRAQVLKKLRLWEVDSPEEAVGDQIRFLTLDEYREQVGDEVYALEDIRGL